LAETRVGGAVVHGSWAGGQPLVYIEPKTGEALSSNDIIGRRPWLSGSESS
jgi:hypothetical protein